MTSQINSLWNSLWHPNYTKNKPPGMTLKTENTETQTLSLLGPTGAMCSGLCSTDPLLISF